MHEFSADLLPVSACVMAIFLFCLKYRNSKKFHNIGIGVSSVATIALGILYFVSK